MKAAESFTIVQAAILEVGAVILPIARDPVAFRRYDLTFRRYYSVIEALHEWNVVCQRFDEDFEVFTESSKKLTSLRGNVYDEQEAESVIRRHREVSSKIRLDIRSVYIFAKIGFITFAGLLFEIAGEKSHDWQQLRRFKKRIANPKSPRLLHEFKKRFGQDIEWFDAQVNLYRNDFIEHPVGARNITGMIYDDKSVRLTGLVGQGFSDGDSELLKRVASSLSARFPELNVILQKPLYVETQLYLWMCQNLEHVPQEYRDSTENMIRRIGLESGDVGQIAKRANSIFANFVGFFGEWYKGNQTKKRWWAEQKRR